MKTRFAALLLAVLLLCAGCVRTEAPVPQKTPAAVPETAAAPARGDYIPATDAYTGMNDPDFWAALCAAPDETRMTAAEIAAFNAAVLADPETLCADLRAYPQTLSRAALEQIALTYGKWPDSGRYTGSALITQEQQRAIYQNINLGAAADSNPVRCAFAVRNAALRSWPSDLPVYESADDVEYDLARESTLRLWEPVLVLHASADGAWLLVQAYNYTGWVAADDLALTDRTQWEALQDRAFLVVRAARLALGDSVYTPALDGTVLTMGTRLPRADATAADNAGTANAWAVLLPLRAEDGTLTTAEARIPFGDDVSEGFPALTDRALLRQVFRLLGQRYGWGGMFGGWDCSSLCADAYAVFGVMLPRNSSRQVRTGVSTDLSAYSDADKLTFLGALRPGALLEIKGHMMFWLGVSDGRGYVIHSTHGFQPQGQPFTVANSVVVSSVDALRSNGKSILTNIRAAADVKNP